MTLSPAPKTNELVSYSSPAIYNMTEDKLISLSKHQFPHLEYGDTRLHGKIAVKIKGKDANKDLNTVLGT